MNLYSYVDTTRANADGTYPVYLIVKNNHGRFFVNTGMCTCGKLIGGRIFPKKDKQYQSKTTLLGKYMADVEAVCLRQELAETDNKTLKSVIQRDVFGVVQKEKKKLLSDYIEMFSELKRRPTAVLYGITRAKVASFKDKPLEAISADWLESFRQHCIKGGMSVNGAGKELRNIRAVFNWCRKNGHTTNYPFSEYSIIEEETMPNNLSVGELRELRDYPCEDWQKKYVDFFMLSFYLAGINPVDLLMMRTDAVRSGHISFVRRKTDKQGAKKIRTIVLPLVDEARNIINRYPSKDGYLLGFMDGRADYHSFVKKCNEALKKVGTREAVADKTGKKRKLIYHPLFPKITLYTARYTFGSIAANDLDISEQTIGQCLGHSWSKHVTARYIAHDQRKIDNAVKRVVEYVTGV